MNQSIQDIIKKIRANGLKPTSQRIAILREILSRRDHPSADDIFRSLKDKFPTLSMNTIYLNLDNFVDKGIITKVNYLHESARFDGNTVPHHHFVCLRCKKIIDANNFDFPDIKMPEELVKAKVFFKQVQFNGICEECNMDK